MTLTNYWWLLIWMFTGGLACMLFFPKRQETFLGKKEIRWNVLPAIIVMAPYMIWGGFRGDVADTVLYRQLFNQMPKHLSGMSGYMSNVNKDKGFSVLSILIKTFTGSNSIVYFSIIAIFQLSVLVWLFRKYSQDYWFSVFVFIATTDYMSWVQNGIRQFTAVTIIMAGTALYLNKRYIAAILLILFASTIHGSAILMIPLLFILQGRAWNKKTILCIAICGVVVLSLSQFTNVLNVLLADTQYKNIVSDWKEFQDDGMSPIRVLVYAVPMILSIIGFSHIRAAENKVIDFCTNASIITVILGVIAMGTSGIFIGRLPIYVSLYANGILLPWEIENIFTKESARLIKIIAIIFYSMFFFYQMHFSWNFI